MYDENTLKIMDRLGMTVTEWNLDAKDFNIAGTATQAAINATLTTYYLETMQDASSWISLQRDLYPVYRDPVILTELLRTIKQRYPTIQMVTLDKCLGGGAVNTTTGAATSGYRDTNVNYLPSSTATTLAVAPSASAATKSQPSATPKSNDTASAVKAISGWTGAIALLSSLLLL